MKLDYSVNKSNEEEIVEQAFPYKTTRESDKYRDFISMQQTVNAALAKNAKDDKVGALNSESSLAPKETVSGWENV